MIQSSWAILLCKFSDNDAEPHPRSRYEEIFTSAGAGKWNMVDYFRDMSHGRLDLSGSEVFGWLTLEQKRSDYTGSGTNDAGRVELIGWARDAAAAAGHDLGRFDSVVVAMNVDTDLCGPREGAITSDAPSGAGYCALSPSLLGQEMGHVYGLQHSRAAGSEEDYMDPFDAMSTARARVTPHPVYTERDQRGNPYFCIGPGLNAANMASLGWLDEARVWTHEESEPIQTTLELRPLHRTDLPGYLALRFQGYFVEFRIDAGWDKGLPPAVYVHTFNDGHSYLEADAEGAQALGPGRYVGTPKELSLFGSKTAIAVDAIDTAREVATVRVAHFPPAVPKHFPPDSPFRNPQVAWNDFFRDLGQPPT